MYGLVGFYIAQEIAKLIDGDEPVRKARSARPRAAIFTRLLAKLWWREASAPCAGMDTSACIPNSRQLRRTT
jgi:hypothetical protein